LLEIAFGFHHGIRMLPGIVRVSGDDEKKVSEMCQQYGAEIAKQLSNEQ